jgi:hypothetical protein
MVSAVAAVEEAVVPSALTVGAPTVNVGLVAAAVAFGVVGFFTVMVGVPATPRSVPGTVAVIDVAVSAVMTNGVASPLIYTREPPVKWFAAVPATTKFVPVMTIDVEADPTPTELGAIDATVGAATVKVDAAVVVVAEMLVGLTTEKVGVPAVRKSAAGTLTVIWVALSAVICNAAVGCVLR